MKKMQAVAPLARKPSGRKRSKISPLKNKAFLKTDVVILLSA
jgi:hypothetical protein